MNLISLGLSGTFPKLRRVKVFMNSRESLHRLLYLALIEIRTEAHELGNKKIFHLADLFHNVPLRLENVLREESSYDEVLVWLRERAQEKGCGEWLDDVIEAETNPDASKVDDYTEA